MANPSMHEPRPPRGPRPPIEEDIEEDEEDLEEQEEDVEDIDEMEAGADEEGMEWNEPGSEEPQEADAGEADDAEEADEADAADAAEEPQPDQEAAAFSARFEDIKVALRKREADRCVIGLDLELVFEPSKPGAEEPEDQEDQEDQEVSVDADDVEGLLSKGAPRPAGMMPMAARAAPAAAKGKQPTTVKLVDVQPGQKNNSVLIVQRALKKAVGLDYSSGPGNFGKATQAAYAKWQRKCDCGDKSTGKPGAASLKKLGQKYGFRVDTRVPKPLKLKFDRKKFFKAYTTTFEKLSQQQMKQLDVLLKAAEADTKILDIRWLAYMLATVRHECGGWRPVREIGRGRGRPYGKVYVVTDPQGKKHRNVYYGRGYVQLTWKGNYQRMGKLLKNRLLYEPNLALKSSVAYRLMSLGMRKGLFTGVGLGNYIRPGGKANYAAARKIINPDNLGPKLARYAVKLEKILRRSRVRAG